MLREIRGGGGHLCNPFAFRPKPEQGQRQRLSGNPLNLPVLAGTGQDPSIGISQDLI